MTINGNSVDIDVETTEMSKNSIMFNALVGALKKDSLIYKSVIEASPWPNKKQMIEAMQSQQQTEALAQMVQNINKGNTQNG